MRKYNSRKQKNRTVVERKRMVLENRRTRKFTTLANPRGNFGNYTFITKTHDVINYFVFTKDIFYVYHNKKIVYSVKMEPVSNLGSGIMYISNGSSLLLQRIKFKNYYAYENDRNIDFKIEYSEPITLFEFETNDYPCFRIFTLPKPHPLRFDHIFHPEGDLYFHLFMHVKGKIYTTDYHHKWFNEGKGAWIWDTKELNFEKLERKTDPKVDEENSYKETSEAGKEIETFESFAAQKGKFLVRKLCLHLDDSDSNLSDVFIKYRDLENQIIEHYIANGALNDNIEYFRKDGKIGYKTAYDKFSPQKLFQNSHRGIKFKERMVRAASYYPYFTVRNMIIRVSNLKKIMRFLKNYFMNSPDILKLFMTKGELDQSVLIDLKKLLNLDIYGNSQSMSTPFLKNHLNQIKKYMFVDENLSKAVKIQLNSFKNDLPADFESKVLSGFSKTKNGEKVTILPENLSQFLKKSFQIAAKRASMTRYTFLSKNPNYAPKNDFERMVKDLYNPDKKKYREDRNTKFNGLFEKLTLQYNLSEIVTEQLSSVIGEYVNAKSPAKNLLKPQFSRIEIQSLDEQGFLHYIRMKIRYKIMELLPLIDNLVSDGVIPVVVQSFDEIDNNLINLMSTPKIKSLTMNLPFRESLWALKNQDSTPLNTLEFQFTPIKERNKKFKLTVSNKTLNRFAVDEFKQAERFFKTPPILKLEGRKIVLIQAIDKMAFGDSQKEDLSNTQKSDKSNNVMGIDLGLKHFAVISIKDKQNQELSRYFLGQNAVFNMKFDELTGKFVKVKNPENSVLNQLRHLYTENRKIQSAISKSENNNLKNTRRHYHLLKTKKCIWQKINSLHSEIVHQTSHRILQIAKYNNVSQIKFEDLRWSSHQAKSKSGKWIARNQIHWLHSQIMSHVAQAASRQSIKVGLVDPAWSSQICSKCAKLKENTHLRNPSYKNGRSSVLSGLGTRASKEFTCSRHTQNFHLDADLNAARNISYRKIIKIL